MLLLLLGQCRGNAPALESVGGTGMVADLLGDPDPRLRYHAACFLQVGTRLPTQQCLDILLGCMASART